MERDVKVGLVLGVLLVAVIAVVFFRREPQPPTAAVAVSSSTEPTPDELPVIRTRPEPYHVSPDYLRRLLSPRLAQHANSDEPQSAARPADAPPPEGELRSERSSDHHQKPPEVPTDPTPEPPPSQVPPSPAELRAAPRPGSKYVVRPGDTLASIAEAAYGSQRYFRVLYEANRDVLVSPGELPVGILIHIPPLDELQTAGDADRRSVRLAATADERSSRGRVYRVRPGDTLRSIARRFYGDERMYRRIFRANRDRLASPADLRPGMELKLP